MMTTWLFCYDVYLDIIDNIIDDNTELKLEGQVHNSTGHKMFKFKFLPKMDFLRKYNIS